MKKLSEYLEAENGVKDFSQHKRIVIAPGRYNPPHRGHKLVIDKLVALGEQLDAKPIVLIIDSGKYGPANPLNGEVRKEYLQKMFPKIRFEVYKNPYDAVFELAEKEQLIPVGGVAGQDRGDNYKGMVGRIFGNEIKDIYHSEVLHRDPDGDDLVGISGTKARKAVTEGNVAAFRAMTGLDDRDSRSLMKLLEDGMNTNGVQSV